MLNRDTGFDFAVLNLPVDQGSRLPEHATDFDAAAGRSRHLQGRVQQTVGSELEQVESLIQQATCSRFPEVEALSRRAAAMGGKRLRPVLVLLSAHSCARGSLAPAQAKDLRAAAAAVELVHAASLVHDDVMDKSEERRHQATVVHQAGNSAAVLLGDFLFTRAYAVAASCASTFPARQIASAATELCEGEMRQQASAANWDLSLATYKSMLTQKTAALCEVSCRLGGWRVGAPRDELRALSQYGKLLGLAFQVYDDWLDYWGSERAVGKTLGTDLAQLKPTLPLIRLLRRADASERQRLIGLLAVGDETALAEIRHQLNLSDAAEYTLAIARRCVAQAKQKLDCLPDSAAKECLLLVADYSVSRAV